MSIGSVAILLLAMFLLHFRLLNFVSVNAELNIPPNQFEIFFQLATKELMHTKIEEMNKQSSNVWDFDNIIDPTKQITHESNSLRNGEIEL